MSEEANSGELFTPEIVHSLLKQVLKGSQHVPARESERIFMLVGDLNVIKRLATYRSSIDPEVIESATHLASAISNLTKYLPMIRQEYAGVLQCVEDSRWPAADAQADLDAIDALVAAARTVAERGLLSHSPALAPAPAVARWTGAARPLMNIFKKAIDGASTEAGYRFIQAVIPQIAGEAPTLEAVKTELKRGRDKNRGEERSNLPHGQN